MKYKNKNRAKIGLITFLVGINLFANFQFANAKALTCGEIADPEKGKGYITAIIEEQFISTGSKDNKAPTSLDDDTNESYVIDCLRVTSDVKKCKTNPPDPSCKPEYHDTYIPLGSCPPEALNCNHIQILVSKTGTSILYTYISLMYKYVATTLSVVCVVIIIYNGLKITISGDDTGAVEEAKKQIGQSLAGLAVLFLSSTILYTINPTFFTR